MEVAQIYETLNTVTQEVLGATDVVQEDLSNIVDIGNQVFNANAVDNYVKKLVDHIGKVIFVNRVYRGNAPSVLMDGWEFGSVLEKVSVDLPESMQNDAWNLVDGQSYDQDTFYAPKVSVKFYNGRDTFMIPLSIREKNVKESFSNVQQLNGFFSMIYANIDKGMTINLDSLVMRTINNMIAQTLYAEYPDGEYSSSSGVRAVNLLNLYNAKFGASLTADAAMTTPEFIRFAAFTIGLYSDRMTRISRLFNVGGAARFTPKDVQHIVMLSDFVNAASVYLQSDTFHDTLVSLPKAETVPYWQGSGQKYEFAEISGIDVQTTVGDATKAVEAGGILGVIFDRDALGVANLDREIRTHYNARAGFINNFYDMTAGYYNDLNENFVVFFVA